MRPSMGERGETLYFLFLQSINQGASVPSFWLWQHRPQWFPSMPKAIFTFAYTLWMPLTTPLGFAPVCYLYKSQLYLSKKL